jgi:hypothetical protein
MLRRLSLVHLAFAAGLGIFLASSGCGGEKASLKADAGQLEQAFGIKPGAGSSGDNSPADLAARAVAAIRAGDWVKAVPILAQLRTSKGLTADQFQAVHNANGNAYVKLVELADKGNADAKAVLDSLKKERDRR